ncbi:glycogenin-2 isoform X15 [Marmota monax]|uniref:glycogenin-2 isoform X15 n=1 Tax=Marmota monax TaxID=9995 RepID=UPI001EB04320|nr:glycogenin-2 isoform X15 [Marmota monax]
MSKPGSQEPLAAAAGSGPRGRGGGTREWSAARSPLLSLGSQPRLGDRRREGSLAGAATPLGETSGGGGLGQEDPSTAPGLRLFWKPAAAAPPNMSVTTQAFVTLATNDIYCQGALVLGLSLRNHKTMRKLVVLITPQVSSLLRDVLSRVFDEVIEVNLMDSEDYIHLAFLKRPELGVTLTKLHCWTLTHYSKCVFLDADTLVLHNIDELFDREELSAAPDPGWPDCFNSGVFVFQPSLETHQLLLQHATEHGSFDGADQGLLNSFFSDWPTADIHKHLPFIYNLTSNAAYTYSPAFQQFAQMASRRCVQIQPPVLQSRVQTQLPLLRCRVQILHQDRATRGLLWRTHPPRWLRPGRPLKDGKMQRIKSKVAQLSRLWIRVRRSLGSPAETPVLRKPWRSMWPPPSPRFPSRRSSRSPAPRRRGRSGRKVASTTWGRTPSRAFRRSWTASYTDARAWRPPLTPPGGNPVPLFMIHQLQCLPRVM